MLTAMTFLTFIIGIVLFLGTASINIIKNGIYGLIESKYKLMGSIAISAISLGIFLISIPVN